VIDIFVSNPSERLGSTEKGLAMKETETISVEADVLEIARAAVEAGEVPSVSVAVERALTAHVPKDEQSSKEDKLRALREAIELSEAEHGPVSDELKAWGMAELERASNEMNSPR
jgi:hypothetical protein